MIVYGIKNCSTMKKAFDWLDGHSVAYTFQDYRTPGLTADEIANILTLTSLDQLVNKRSTAWRALTEDEKKAVMNEKTAIKVLQAHPTLIKRPLIITDSQVSVGFSQEQFKHLFLK